MPATTSGRRPQVSTLYSVRNGDWTVSYRLNKMQWIGWYNILCMYNMHYCLLYLCSIHLYGVTSVLNIFFVGTDKPICWSTGFSRCIDCMWKPPDRSMCTLTQVPLKGPTPKTKEASRWPPLFPSHVTGQCQHVSLSAQWQAHTDSHAPLTACQRTALDTHCHQLNSDTANASYLMGTWQANYKFSRKAVEL